MGENFQISDRHRDQRAEMQTRIAEAHEQLARKFEVARQQVKEEAVNPLNEIEKELRLLLNKEELSNFSQFFQEAEAVKKSFT